MNSSLAAQAEWARRIEAEYRSSALTHNLVLWLIQLGAPRELLDEGLAIVRDELDHAELCVRVYAEAGGTQARRISQGRLGLTRSGDLVSDVARECVRTFCLGETVAVPLFRELRAECTVPCAKEALDRVLRDEVRHRQYGWDLLDWLLDAHPGVRPLVERELPALLASIRCAYAAPATVESEVDRTWGLMPAAWYACILDETAQREFRPRFARVGLEIGFWVDGNTPRPPVCRDQGSR